MLDEERTCEFDVSEFYFRLTTESIRLLSNRLKTHCSLNRVIHERAALLCDLTSSYATSDMQEHLSIIPTAGDIPLHFAILEASAASIDNVVEVLQEALGTSFAFADAVSLMMYDLVVEEAKTEVLTKLGLSSEQAEKYRKILRKRPSNIVPFR